MILSLLCNKVHTNRILMVAVLTIGMHKIAWLRAYKLESMHTT